MGKPQRNTLKHALEVPLITMVAVLSSGALVSLAQEEPSADFDKLKRDYTAALQAKEYAKALVAAEGVLAVSVHEGI